MNEGGVNIDLFSQDFINEMKDYEGSLDYQKHLGTYTGERFMPYEDTKGYTTIGYGHKVVGQELDLWGSGMTVEEADSLLYKDLSTAYDEVSRYHDLYEKHPDVGEVLTDIYYQHGSDVMLNQFPAFREAIDEGEYTRAAANLMYVNPDAPPAKRKESEYYSEYKDRADKNIDKLLAINPESHSQTVEDDVMDIISNVDENPLEIKRSSNYLNILSGRR